MRIITKIRTRKSKKGISSILGTVIVLAITIALGALLYAYANGMFTSTSQTNSINIQAQIIVNPSANASYLQYSLQNTGSLQVNITSISIQGATAGTGGSTSGSTISTKIVLAPGDTISNVTALSGTFTVGKYYTIIFSGKTATGKPFSEGLNVLATETG